ncbi:MAG: translocation/assembly module TamB domain-containing protein [Proteobacteria bacterium]|nr:translocation/assembly module TamB domain-containing protein [Pseudomonadota bacterium]
MRMLRLTAWILGGLVAVVALLFAVLQTPPGKQALAGIVSSMASSADSRLEVSGISGFIPTDLRVAKIEMSDPQGVWLNIEDAHLAWSFASLFTGRLKIEDIAAQKIEALRPPAPAKAAPSEASSGGGASLPFGVELDRLAVADLHVGAPLGGVDSHWKIDGSGAVAGHGQSRFKLDMVRTDGPTAQVAADLGFTLAPFAIDGRITGAESGKGGIVAALIGRPDLDQVSFKLIAKGDAANGTADLDASAGNAIQSKGTARWHPESGATAVAVDMSVVAPGLPDSPVARLLRTPATLKGEASLDPSGALAVRSLALAVGPAQVDATGQYDPQKDRLQATVKMHAGEAGPLADLAGGIDWRNLRADLTADLTNLFKHPQGAATLTASVDDLAARSLGERGPPPQHVELSAKLDAQPDGRLVVQSIDLSSPLVALKGTAGYQPSTEAGDGKIAIDVPNLALLSGLAGTQITGRGHLDLDLSTKTQTSRVAWRGTLDDLGVPNMPPDLKRQTLKLSGAAALQKDRSWQLDGVRVGAEGLTFTVSGQGRDQTGDLNLSLDLPRLDLLQAGMSGAASANGKVTLKPDGGDVRVSIDLSNLRRGKLTSQHLALLLDASLEGEAAHGQVTAQGDLAQQPLSLSGSFARNADGGLQVPTLQGSWASASVDVKDLVVAPGRATGSGHLKMARLEDLAPIIGTPVAGAIDLDVATASDNPAGTVTIALKGDRLRSGTTGVNGLRLDASVADPFGAAKTDATVKASGLVGVADLNGVTATVKGDRTAFDIAVQAAGRATNANVMAKVEPGADAIRIALQRLDARYQGIPVALNAPTQVTVAGQRITIQPASLRLGGGRLGIGGTVDEAASDLSVEIAALPLSLVEAFAPGTGIQGTLQAKLHVTGATANPRIEATYSADGVRIKRPEMALVPAIALRGTASVVERQATLDATVTAGSGTRLGIKGKSSIPQGNAPLSATVGINGAMDIAPFSAALGDSIRNVAGTLSPNLNLTVNGNAINGSGTIVLSNATLFLPATGLRLTGGRANVVLQGETLQLQSLSFQTARNGSISGTGTVRLDPVQGFPVDLGITAHNALVANRPDLIAAISSDVKIRGSTLAGFDVTGPVTVDRADINIGGTQLANYPTIAVTEINGNTAPGPAAPKPASPPSGKVQPQPPAEGGVRLALDINAPQAVFVRGRGLDAEVGGKFTVTGNPSAPAVLGNLTLRRGTFNLAGHQLNFTRGNVALMNANEIDPELDFAASTIVNSTTIEVDITGSARAPKFVLTSSPSLPQDEAMAMLLFGKPSSGLSPFEILSAAQALAELTGQASAGGTGFLGRLRKGLGLDQLSINSSSSNAANASAGSTTSIQGGRYVAPGVYVGAQQGASGDSSRGIVEIEVLPHTKIEGSFGTDSNEKIGAKMEWDY